MCVYWLLGNHTDIYKWYAFSQSVSHQSNFSSLFASPWLQQEWRRITFLQEKKSELGSEG